MFVIGSGVVSILLTALDVNSVGHYDLTRLTTLSGELSEMLQIIYAFHLPSVFVVAPLVRDRFLVM